MKASTRLSTCCTILVVVAALVEIYSCQQCSYDTNIDYFGNDLLAEPVFTNSSDGCCMYCANNTKCQVWTWVPATKACWIKTNVGSRRFKSLGRASGVRQYVSGMNYGYGGGNYGNGGGSGNYGNGGGNYGNGGGNYGNGGGNYGNGGGNYGMGGGNYGNGGGNYGMGGGSYGMGGGYGAYNTMATITTAAPATITTAAASVTTAGATTVTATTTTTLPPIGSTVGATLPGGAPTTTTQSTANRLSVCFIENNANYPGGDIIGQANVATPSDCCNLCGQTSGCVAWSYFTTFNYCYLKNSAPASPGQPYPFMVSGKIVQSPALG